MPTIVFTWEIGHGFGHVMPLLPLARQLKQSGCKVIFALRDVRAAGHMLATEGFTVLQAPFHPDRFLRPQDKQPDSMADILALFGFADDDHLSSLRSAWTNLLTLCQADIVVASYAPLSLLCARALGLQTVLFALPFELPPPVHPSFNYRTGQPKSDDSADLLVLQTTNTIFQDAIAPLNAVYEIFHADLRYMMCFEALDAFAPRGHSKTELYTQSRATLNYVGNFFELSKGAFAQWPESTHTKRVFVYLHTQLPHLDHIRTALHALPMGFSVFLRGATSDHIQQWSAPNTWVSAQVLQLNDALLACDAVLSYSGQGMVSAALCAGKPLLLYPQDIENALTARQVVRMGAGIVLGHSQIDNLGAALTKLVHEPQWRSKAAAFAQRYQGRDMQHVTDAIAHAILCPPNS